MSAFGAGKLVLRKSGQYAGSVASVRFANFNHEKVNVLGTFLFLLAERDLNFGVDTEYLNCKCFLEAFKHVYNEAHTINQTNPFKDRRAAPL